MAEKDVLIKSYGYGIYSLSGTETEFLRESAEYLGEVVEVVQDRDDPARVFVLTAEGAPPHPLQIELFKEDSESLQKESMNSPALYERLKLLQPHL